MRGRLWARPSGSWAFALTADSEHPSALFSLPPQTVAECVLYYYLTKKNENYKSLVRRSYRRRGKSQVRGRRKAVGLRGRFPACSAASGPWALTPLHGLRLGPPVVAVAVVV